MTKFWKCQKTKNDLNHTRKYDSSKFTFRNTIVICKICNNTQKLVHLAVILALGQKNPFFLHFLNPYIILTWDKKKSFCNMIKYIIASWPLILTTLVLQWGKMPELPRLKFINKRVMNYQLLPKDKCSKKKRHVPNLFFR